ncbi:MAG: archaemetzincin family Zn-dependent metalloprotease [Candidatus Abyssubacteria bacterium]
MLMVLVLAQLAVPAAKGNAMLDTVLIVPVGGNLSEDELRFLVPALEDSFGAKVSFSARIPLPVRAYNRERGQYMSNVILDELRTRVRTPKDGRVLGVTAEDLYVPDLNFVFGQVDVTAGVCLISLARLRPEFYGRQPDEALFHRRAITEAIHEVGHTLGLNHCPSAACVMHFSNSLADTDLKSHRFCNRCRRILGMELE